MLRGDIGEPCLDGMPVVLPGECGNDRRNWASEDTGKIGLTRKRGGERECFVSRCDLGVCSRFVPARVDTHEFVVRHQNADQSVKDEGSCPVVAPQALVTESSRDVRRAQKGDEQVALGIAETGALAENLGSAQSNPSSPRVAGVRDGVAHPTEKVGDGVKARDPRREANSRLDNCIGLPVDDIAGREKWSRSE